jgi:hypothetical protein
VCCAIGISPIVPISQVLTRRQRHEQQQSHKHFITAREFKQRQRSIQIIPKIKESSTRYQTIRSVRRVGNKTRENNSFFLFRSLNLTPYCLCIRPNVDAMSPRTVSNPTEELRSKTTEDKRSTQNKEDYNHHCSPHNAAPPSSHLKSINK